MPHKSTNIKIKIIYVKMVDHGHFGIVHTTGKNEAVSDRDSDVDAKKYDNEQ
jgi:hypothetical protein